LFVYKYEVDDEEMTIKIVTIQRKNNWMMNALCVCMIREYNQKQMYIYIIHYSIILLVWFNSEQLTNQWCCDYNKNVKPTTKNQNENADLWTWSELIDEQTMVCGVVQVY
jgi:hypothetical protein